MSKNSNKKRPGWIGLILLIAAAAVGLGLLMLSALGQDAPAVKPTQTTSPADQTLSEPDVQVQMKEFSPIYLGYGLTITDAGSYTGIYMEDGTDEFVSGVAMIVVTNEGEDDIQLADIELSWDGELCSFRLTNLASGTRVVLLEQERKLCPDGVPELADAKNLALFSEPMALCEDQLRISGMDGMLNITNVSDADIDGDIYIYYKYAADDLFYGGITFRVRVEGGLAAGEIRQIPAGHYRPDGCTIVHVECHG